MGVINYLFGWKRWDIRRGEVVLELGSGGSPMVRSNILLDRYIDDDAERESNIAKDRPLVCADIESMPFKENSFDFVYGSHVLEHLDDPEEGIKEITRVGKRGLIIVPGEIFERNWDKATHKWIITRDQNRLVFRRKCACTQLTQNDVLGEWKSIFWKVYSNNKDLLDIHLLWENTIPCEIIECKDCNSKQPGYEPPKIKRGRIERIKLRYRVKAKVKFLLSRIIRFLYA